MLSHAGISHGAIEAPGRILSTYEYRTYPHSTRIDADRVVFSDNGSGGDKNGIVAITVATGEVRPLVTGFPDVTFVAADTRYLAFIRSRPNAGELVVQATTTNARLGSLRLRDPIRWAHIFGDRLVLLQDREALVYRLPDLKRERSVPIDRVYEAQLWNEQIVALGDKLTIYDSNLSPVAVADLPAPDPNATMRCQGGALRIFKDQAIARSNCDGIAVFDLPEATLRQVVTGLPAFTSFDVIDGLIFVAINDGDLGGRIQVHELESGRELARLPMANVEFLAANAGSLLAMQYTDWSAPVQVTSFVPDLAALRSEPARINRVRSGCSASDIRDIYRAIDECEAAGIRGYVKGVPIPPALQVSARNYGTWLAQSLSRYDEAVDILERLEGDPLQVKMIELAKRKAKLIQSPGAAGQSLGPATAPGIRRLELSTDVPYSEIAFIGDRAYISGYDCNTRASDAITLTELDRQSFAPLRRISVNAGDCDEENEDRISSISQIPGFLVLGLEHKYSDGLPNVAVVDLKTFAVTAQGEIAAPPVSLGLWNDWLLRCAASPGEPHTRFDPATASLVLASTEQSLACLNGDVVMGASPGYNAEAKAQRIPVVTTPGFKGYEGDAQYPLRYFRFTPTGQGAAPTKTIERQYLGIWPIAQRDGVVLSYRHRQERRYLTFDIRTGMETTILGLGPDFSDRSSAVWQHYLFVASDYNLLVYDLDRLHVAWFGSGLTLESANSTDQIETNNRKIMRLLVDGDRLLVLTLDGANSRIIDLPTLAAQFTGKDFFFSQTRDQVP